MPLSPGNKLMKLTIDFETRSPLDIKKVGPWAYAEHPETDVLCMAIKANASPAGIWVNPKFRRFVSGRTIDAHAISNTLAKVDIVEAHNSEFERAIWRKIMVPRYGWPDIPDSKWRCSAAKAAAFALPRSLEGAGAALKLPIQKDMEGHRIMLKLCRPRKPRKGENPNGLYWNEDPADFLKLFQYCLQDVETEHAVSTALPDLAPMEQRIWHLDQKMNERGVLADTESAAAIIATMEGHKETLLKEVEALSGGMIRSVKQTAVMTEYCQVANMQKATVAAALKEEIAPDVRRLLEIRQSLGLASVSKYKAILVRACEDGRLRSNLLFHAASTGRWGGKGVQLQNLPRKSIPADFIELALTLFRKGDLTWIGNLFGDPMELAQAMIRPMITASPGHDLICADFSSIEARVLLWLAGEKEGLEVFRSGADVYCFMADSIYQYDRPITKKDKIERQVGKIAILGLGYGMGGPKFQITCALPQPGAFVGDPVLPGVIIEKKFARKVVQTYRKKFPGVPSFWYATERAAIEATLTREPVECGKTVWSREDRWLFCRPPSGRRLVYPYPAVKIEPAYIYPCINEDGNETSIMIIGKADAEKRAKKRAADEDLKIVGPPIEREKSVLSFMAVVAGKKWMRETTYGGKLVENIDQAISRDLMAWGMLRLEKAGYPMLLSVHDEAIAEVPEGFGSVEEFEKIMSAVPKWAEGCPIAAEGWRGKRYRK